MLVHDLSDADLRALLRAMQLDDLDTVLHEHKNFSRACALVLKREDLAGLPTLRMNALGAWLEYDIAAKAGVSS